MKRKTAKLFISAPKAAKINIFRKLKKAKIKLFEPAKANVHKHHGETVVSHGAMKAAPEGEFIDPVCGMSVAPETAAGKYDFEGETYYFCSTGCLNKFKQNPKNFLAEKQEEKHEAESQGTEYTCPMHPEIVQIGPGSCPICGMALEPKVISLDDAPDPELIDMNRRFWISAALTIPVFILAMAEMFPGFNEIISTTQFAVDSIRAGNARGFVGRFSVF